MQQVQYNFQSKSALVTDGTSCIGLGGVVSYITGQTTIVDGGMSAMLR